MSLSPWEEQILSSIQDTISRTDPELAGLLATFTKLAAGEDMPRQENVQAPAWMSRRLGAKRRPRRWRRLASRAGQRFGFRRLGLVLWLVISIVLVATALVLSRGSGQSACPDAWVAVCASPSPARDSPAVSPERRPARPASG